jgi:bifunctional non-homologous end joining protein LigD
VRPDGTTSFSALQGHGDTPAELVYFAFDLLHLDGEDLMRLPLLERKARLETLLSGAPARSCFRACIGCGRSWSPK